jgi:hypothetical protein
MKNCTYMKSLPNKTPYEMGHKAKPNLSDSYEWGTEVYAKIKQTDKLEPRAKNARWIRHASLSDGYYIFWPNSQKVSIKRNIVFPTKNEPKYALIIPSDQNHPTYIHQKLAEA